MGRWDDVDRRWRQEAEQVLSGMKEWRLRHPTATFTEIETALDAQLGALRTRLLEDLALATRAADLKDKQAGAPPRCPRCGARLEARGKQPRHLQVHGGQAVALERDDAVCVDPACQAGLFPPG